MMDSFVSVYLVPKAASDFYRPSFLGSVYESHVVMAQVQYDSCNFFKAIEANLVLIDIAFN